MGKLRFWIENRDEWATDNVKRTFLEISRMSYGKMMNAFLDAKESEDESGMRLLALELCKDQGFLSESLTEVDDNGETPLHAAAAGGIVRAVGLLLDAGAEVDKKDDQGCTALAEAARGGIVDAINVLLAAGADPNSSDVDGKTPLIGSAQGGHVRCCEALIDSKADVNKGDNSDFTPLMWATQTNKTDAVEFLISRGADVHRATSLGWNALFDAANSGHIGPARVLISAGIDVNSHRSTTGICPLSFACLHGHARFVEYLLDEGGANIEEINHDGDTPLHYAAEKGQVETVKVLLQRGANPLARNSRGSTPDEDCINSECSRLIEDASLLAPRSP